MVDKCHRLGSVCLKVFDPGTCDGGWAKSGQFVYDNVRYDCVERPAMLSAAVAPVGSAQSRGLWQ